MTLLPESGLIPVRLRFMRLLLVCGSGALILKPSSSAAATLQFQSGFLRQGPGYSSDAGVQALDSLTDTQDLVPGNYWIEIYVNTRYFGQRQIRFIQPPTGEGLVPCFSSPMLEQMGLRVESLAEPALLQEQCVDLLRLVPGSQIEFDGGRLQLSLSVPQVAMRRDMIGQVDPALWDHGINAAFFSYQASAQQSTATHTGSRNSADL